MTRALQLAAAVALLAGVAPARARADVWSDATGGEAATVAGEIYARQMEQGDDEAQQAAVRLRTPRSTRVGHIDNAVQAYEAAAAANPTAADPYARIGKLLYSTYFEQCDASTPEMSPLCGDTDANARAVQMIAAWDALEAHSPLDPRLPICERAIAHTKLATPEHLAAAARDYRAIITRGHADSTVTNNLAETYMMLGDLDGAIDMYRRSLEDSLEDSTAFGLAVALDRDGQTAEAKNLLLEIGPTGFATFAHKVQTREIFFVPAGEVFYYFALAHETLGDPESAVDEWQAFIDSGAHPRYQPRAKEHLALLRARLKLAPKLLRPAPPLGLFDE